MEMPENNDGVILLHGISRTALSFRKMQTALEAAGFATLNIDYPSRHHALEPLAEHIHPAVTHLAAGIAGQLHFVGHSMGGLLARVYISRYRPQHLGRVVMLGTPNGGSEIADRLKNVSLYRAWFGPASEQLVTRRDAATGALFPPVDYPVGIIAGNRSLDPTAALFLQKPHDGPVSVENTKLDGMTDHIVIGTAHPWLPRNNAAIAQTIAFLRDGRFGRQESG
ncbi:alpha/beta fold hydrolase [Bradyrhizobium sp. AUGA SZCCT0177]|uniref:alpha/beta fold hydrolase n=1 Tax=Bradyrhizobium sp. AUGA SZCCT0177 TaxID=2807665 RepID=UPI001BABBA32|nr:alpha/beta fold hydrolase [Bradyrhizobium sp. AUGA SZCCT0177]MBR1284261.1 alpha/beta fold hydrolase [Bradyrhizobium sp. AUGA SZCCT0177]